MLISARTSKISAIVTDVSRRTGTLLALCFVLLLSSCAPPAQVQRPGSFNQFDSQTYDTLNVIQAAIEQAKTDLPSFPAAKPILNKVIASYNLTMQSYKTYHAALGSGTLIDRATLEAQLQVLTSDFTALREAMKK